MTPVPGTQENLSLHLSSLFLFIHSLTWTTDTWNLMLFLHSATSIKLASLLTETTLRANSISRRVFITWFQNPPSDLLWKTGVVEQYWNKVHNVFIFKMQYEQKSFQLRHDTVVLSWKDSKLQETCEGNLNLQNGKAESVSFYRGIR